MGVYVKGMEMPKSCDECRIMTFEDTNCVPELFCGCPIVFQAHPQGVGYRPDYCPLAPIPPHGRLFDANAVFDLVMQYCPDDDGVCSKAGADLRELLDEIENLPTVIPAEEGE